ncbi:unnamed protein product [Cylindrotheca closterium]|uniref:Uncharacterized protein n=1 Tax=Cylindrotheca closterium TaxID=2856 RepID=A0AAD2G6J2_9STRA|nr:unnamed protein product [Cylindrotheca closterium]
MMDRSNETSQKNFGRKVYERKQQTLLRKGIAMNNKAIADLSHGSRQQAPYEVLMKGFHLIRRVASKKLCGRAACDKVNVCHGTFSFNFANVESFRHGYIYNRLLSIDAEQLPSNSKIAADLCLSITVLNLALINHNQSLTIMNSNNKYASLANDLYNHAISALGHMENRGTAALVRIAALNNLMQLRCRVGNHSLAMETLQHLGQIMAAGSLDREQRKRIAIDEEAKRGIILNILSLGNQNVAAAA